MNLYVTFQLTLATVILDCLLLCILHSLEIVIVIIINENNMKYFKMLQNVPIIGEIVDDMNMK